MTVDLPDGSHELTVLVRNKGRVPIFRVALTLNCVSNATALAQCRDTIPPEVVIVSSTAVMLN